MSILSSSLSRASLWTAALLGLVAAAACNSGKVPIGTDQNPITCQADSDCPSGDSCVTNVCQKAPPSGCSADTDCASGQACVNGECVAAPECTANTDCAPGQVCAAGACVDFFVSPACTTCPCGACGSGTTCCSYPGTTEAVCVTGTTCPM